MEVYNKQPEQRNDFAVADRDSAADRYARRLAHQLGLPTTHVHAALVANAAVKER